ncbi:MAG: signal peptidase I [Armatimonadota bacterium]
MRYDLDSPADEPATNAASPAGAQTLSPSRSAVSASEEQKARRMVRLLILLIVFGMCALFFTANFRVVVIEGDSMEPTYHHGQRVLMTQAYWLFGPIREGDVVVIELPGGARLVKRVVALGGAEVPRAYWGPAIRWMGTRVPTNHVYVVGDNLERSEDSRHMGPLPMTWVQGKIVGGYSVKP